MKQSPGIIAVIVRSQLNLEQILDIKFQLEKGKGRLQLVHNFTSHSINISSTQKVAQRVTLLAED